MHANSLRLMRKFFETYEPGRTVLDVGAKSYKRQKTYRSAAGDRNYTGADIQAGPNVDVVLPSPYDWRNAFGDGQFHCVITGQTLEHSAQPWRLFHEMTRVLRRGGLMCVIAPWTWAIHSYPKDYWRILPDGMRSLGEWSRLEVLEARADQNDTVGVFRR